MKVMELELEAGLKGPTRDDAASTRQWHLATGGGVVALVNLARGLVGVGSGPDQFDSCRLPAPEMDAPISLHAGPGQWERRFEGGLERGLVTETGLVVVQHWSDPTGPGVPRSRVVLGPAHPLWEGEPQTTAEEANDALKRAVVRRLRPLEARERQRALRPHPGGLEEATPALQILDDAALALDAEGRPRGPFLAGIEGRPHSPHPTYVAGSGLAEVGLAALLAGRFELAHALLDELLTEEEPPAIALLALVARQVHWMGRPDRLLAVRNPVEDAIQRMKAEAPSDAGAAWPSPAGTLTALARAVEPVDPEWARRIIDDARVLRAGPGPAGGPVRLPVLGARGPDQGQTPSRPDAPSLPPPGAFAPMNHPGVLDRQTLHAARLLRSKLEGTWGLDADAHVGRIVVAPDLPQLLEGVSILRLAGLRVADAHLDMDCRALPGRLTLAVSQTGGRVPLQVVFEPRLPFRTVSAVHTSSDGHTRDEPMDVTLEAEDATGTTRLRVQFPLDPERRLIVDGTP